MIKGNYLRVLTPKTSDGVTLITKNDKIQYKEDHLPVTARKMLERKNARLPPSLKMKIEEIENKPMPKPSRQQVVDVTENEDVETFDHNEEVEEPAVTNAVENGQQQPERKKPGPKPKNQSNG